jgi:hypothetical protein
MTHGNWKISTLGEEYQPKSFGGKNLQRRREKGGNCKRKMKKGERKRKKGERNKKGKVKG